ncbi:HNH endonuclease signature motif containing protein [Sinomonas sp. P10A9]|uniref:DUF222 domain-containing protein n=1 Tax=Sinomonas puerhi TaxID=3238584 RepID=A0AB39L2U2_9MICC
MSIEHEFDDGFTGSGEALPWWLAGELDNVLQAEEDVAAAGGPVEPEPWMVKAWELSDDPSTRPVRPPRPDDELLAIIAADLRAAAVADPDALVSDLFIDGELPSPAAIVAEVEAEAAGLLVARLERLDREDASRAAERTMALAALVRAVGGWRDDPFRRIEAPSIAASEVSAALKISARTAKGMVSEALELSRPSWAPLVAAMSAGRLPQRRVRTILDAAIPIPSANLGAFVAEAVDVAAPTDSHGTADPDRIPSPGALGRRLRRLAEKHSAEPLAARKAKAREHRRVDVEPAGDAMCWLTAYLPLEDAAAIDSRLESLARSLKGPTEGRTLPQLRADVFTDLLGEATLAGEGSLGGFRAQIIATIPAGTLAGTCNAAAEILGYGPIDPDAARLLASQAATWTRMWVDPGTGAPLAIGRTRYTPTAAMRRQLGVRDMVCRFPGCDKPASATEADHTTSWASGGETSTDNLALLCPEHHRLKSEGYWSARQIGRPQDAAAAERFTRTDEPAAQPHSIADTRGRSARAADSHATEPEGADSRGAPSRPPAPPPGTIEWISPTGRRYITYPEGDPPPPF